MFATADEDDMMLVMVSVTESVSLKVNVRFSDDFQGGYYKYPTRKSNSTVHEPQTCTKVNMNTTTEFRSTIVRVFVLKTDRVQVLPTVDAPVAIAASSPLVAAVSYTSIHDATFLLSIEAANSFRSLLCLDK